MAVTRWGAALCAVWMLAALARGWVVWTPAFALSACLWAGLWLRAGRRPGQERPTAFCFLTCLTLYLSTFRWHGGDDITNSLIPLALLKHGTLALTPVISPFLDGKAEGFTVAARGQLLSFHPIATGILATPFYVIPVLFRASISEQFLHNLSKVSAACITAASVAAFYRAVAARASRSWALLLAFAYGLGSFAFSVSSQALWQHGTAQLGIALALWGLAGEDRRADLLTGFGLGLAIAAREDSVFIAAAVGLWLLLQDRKRVPGVVLGALPPLVFLLSYWFHYTGRFAPPSSLRQEQLFGLPTRQSLLGLLASPTRGLLPFCPAALFGLGAAFSGERRERRLSAALLFGCAATWVFLSCYGAWVAGETYGPRYLCVVALVLLYLGAFLERPLRRRPALLSAFAASTAFGVWVHALGGYLTWPGAFDVTSESGQIWRWDLHPVANLLNGAGPLSSLPLAGRAAILAACLLACTAAAAALTRSLLIDGDRVTAEAGDLVSSRP